MRTGAVFAAVLGITVAIWSPSAGQASAGPLSYNTLVSKATYTPVEPVEMRLMVRNETAEPVTLIFPSSQRFDFIVRGRAGEVWRWSHGKRFLDVVQTVSLGSRQTLEYVVSWDQRDSNGRPVRPGAYEVVAVFLGTTTPGTPPVTLPPVSFTVVTSTSPEMRPVVTARVWTINGHQVGEVLVGESVALRIRAAAGGRSPVQRAEVVAERLRRLLGIGLNPERLTVAEVSGEAAVVWDGVLVVTADRRHASLNGTTPMSLARQWRDAMAKTLAVHR